MATIAAGRVDLIAIGRKAFYDPHWASHAARTLGADPGWWVDLRETTGIAEENE